MSINREWMYRRYREDGSFNPDFQTGLNSFIQFATSQPMFMDGTKIKCPCRSCDNIPYQEAKTVRYHIAKHGFVHNYQTWRFQGETSIPLVEEVRNWDTVESPNMYRTMVMDAAGPEFNLEEPPNPEAKKFFDMLDAADKELWPGCKNHSQLSLVARLMSLKSENNMSQRCFDQITYLIKEIVPENNLVPANYYNTKKLLRGMGLPVEKIDCCPRNCMIYWREDIELVRCKFCNLSRYKSKGSGSSKNTAEKKMYYFPLTPRLQREIEQLAEELRQPLPGTTEPQEVDLNKCYLEVTGGLDHKGRLFGGGSLAHSVMSPDSGTSSASTSQIDRNAIDTRLEEMQQQLEQAREQQQ